jgi:hypothetical protein
MDTAKTEESNSKEEVKMVENVEQLKQEQPVIQNTESLQTSEPVVQATVEKLEEVKPVENTEQLKTEEPVVAKVEMAEMSKETLAKDIEKTKEELQVVKEVRDEIVTLYAKYKDMSASKESLAKELETVKAELLSANEQLTRYHTAEAELKAKEHKERVEKLSENFKLLGQDKTVEQLMSKDMETLSEFEAIVESALKRANDTKEQLSVTVPSQGIESKKQEEKLSDVAKTETKEQTAKPVVKQVAKPDFFKTICNKLTVEQSGNGAVRYL